jgi:hypothetical protein
MMNSDWLCKCGHSESKHTVLMKACQYDDGGCLPSSECACYVCADETKCIWYSPIDNLEYLEKLSER